jgi:hypothetical protein
MPRDADPYREAVTLIRDIVAWIGRDVFARRNPGLLKRIDAVLSGIKSKPRSLPQHRRFFALIRAAYHHWPDDHPEIAPTSESHLRAYLECKANYFTQSTVEPEAVLNSVNSPGGFSFVKVVKGKICVFTPKSISFEQLGHQEACQLFDDITDVIYAETGLRAEELLKEDRLGLETLAEGAPL